MTMPAASGEGGGHPVSSQFNAERCYDLIRREAPVASEVRC